MATRYWAEECELHEFPEAKDSRVEVVLAADHEREVDEIKEEGYRNLAQRTERFVQDAERDHWRIAELEKQLQWACDQLVYYLPKPMDTEASRVFDEARALLDGTKKK